jgi:hypothetical protein
MKPYSDLVGSGAEHIHRTFVISKEEAARIAADYIGLIEGKGGDPANFSPQSFAHLLTKQLTRRLEWRDPAVRETWDVGGGRKLHTSGGPKLHTR